jgi:tetratricopeptide (TPR) repeat protein
MLPRFSLSAPVRPSTIHTAPSEVGRVIPNTPVGRQTHTRLQIHPTPLRRLCADASRLFKYTFTLLTAFVLLSTFARAQSVRWEPSSGSLAHGQTSELSLIFDGCEPTGSPAIPAVSGLTFQRGGEMRNTSIVNGRMSQSVTLNFAARPSVKQRVTIPAFSVDTDKGKLTVPAASFDVGDATIGGSGLSLESVVTARFQAPREVWAGEVFPLTYNLSILRRYAHSLGSELEWAPAPLAIEAWSKPEQRETVVGGENHIVVSQATRAVVRSPGTVTLNAGNQLVNVVKGTDMWGRANLDQFAVTSDRPVVTVKPLPEGAPAAFNGAVGKFTLESKVVPVSANVGDPITWTLTLSGTGNWPDLPGLPAREASKDFRAIQPQAKRANKDGALFEATLTEDVVLIPTKDGTYTLGPVSFTYFDPAKGAYQTVTTPRTTVSITAPAPAPVVGGVPSPRTGETASNAGTQTAPPKSTLTPPGAPAAIPRDPLLTNVIAPLPLSPRTLLLCALSPLAPLLAFWFWLALRRAQKTDPFLPQREARARLAATLAQLRSTQDRGKIIALLQSWQRDTAALWPLNRAVPSATDFSDVAASLKTRTDAIPTSAAIPPASVPASPAPTSTTSPSRPSPSDAAWAALWLDAERCLYRADTPLPADWIARAETALAARPVKSFSAFSIFRPRNLLPFAATLIVCLSAITPDAQAQGAAVSAYARSDFSSAEKFSREQLAKNPTDWAAHYNLSLALAQQNRWQESAAHAATAFVQHPGDASIRWHLALALEKAGYTPTAISAFINPSPAHSLAREYSPAVWQRIMIGASALLALAIALGILRVYGAHSRALKPAAWTLGALALAVLALSVFSLRLYSPTSDIRAALVWKQSTLRSIPTEADTAQKTTPLAAGSVAIVDKTFLGWSRLAFPNGQTGWVRKEELRPFWQ